MVYDPNTNWSAAADDRLQAPVYFLRIEGRGADYSTHPVKNAATTKKILMDAPSGLTTSLDPISGTRPVSSVRVPLLDVDGEITKLLATEADGAYVSSLINRQATIYGGYRHLDEADYAAVFAGRITGVTMAGDGSRYVLTITDPTRLLDGEIMSNATSDKPTTIAGNPINVCWSILTGTFSTTHADFPLTEVSTDTSTTSAPTGLGISTSEINESQLIEQRDAWYPDALVKVTFVAPEVAKTHLQQEFFRVFQGWPVISQDGKIGLRFHVPPVPSAAAEEITEDDIIGPPSWERLYSDHLNRFVYYGNYDASADSYDAILYNTETSADTADQSATGETIIYEVKSRWLRNDLANDYGETGADIAADLASRMRLRYLKTPARVVLNVGFQLTRLEEGDVVAVTHPAIPDLLTGSRGVTARLMSIVSRSVDFAKGTIRLVLLDTGFKRYGVIAPSGTADYTSTTAKEQNTFVFVSNTSGQMSNGDPGYRMA